MWDIRSWATEEFQAVRLGDARLEKRLKRIAERFAERPAGHVTQVLVGAEREAGFRFIENDRVQAAAIAGASHIASARRCVGTKLLTVPVDQSTLSVVDKKGRKGLGRTSANTQRLRGLEVMTALAVTDGVVQGVLAQEWWQRAEEHSPQWNRDRRPEQERESDLWRRVLNSASATLRQHATDVEPWFQLDRGGDLGAVLRCAKDLGLQITVRAAYDRCVQEHGHLHQALDVAPVLGTYELPVPRGYKRQPRLARIEVRASSVRLSVGTDVRNKGRCRIGLDFFVVRARELDPPSGVEPINWTLLTTYPVDSLDDALLVVRAYTSRWRVEDFHLAWKSGVCDIETSQLRSANAFMRWATIAAAVAARAERLKTLSRASPDAPALSELTVHEIDAAILLSETKRFKVGEVLTLEQAVRLIADIGGYTGKSSGGPPGTRVIQRGLDRVLPAAHVLALTRSG
jgi:hypothetical protein